MAGTANSANPQETQARFGFEATPCLGDVTNFDDFRLLSESVGADLDTIDDESLDPGGEETQGDPGKIIPGGDLVVNYHAEDHAKLIASYFGKGAAPVESPTGVWTHKLAPTETVETFPTGSLEISRGKRRPYLYNGVVPLSLGFNAAPNGYLNGPIGLSIPRFHPFADATIETGTPPASFLRGLPTFDFLQEAVDSERRVFLEVQSVDAGVSVTVKCKIGAVATYDGADIVVPVGVFTRLTDENDAEVGSFDLPVEWFFATDTGFVALDEIYFQVPRTIWAPALAERSVFNEISMEILVDDVIERVNAFTAVLTRQIIPDDNIGGRFIDATIEQGARTSLYTINRRAFSDETMVDRLLTAEQVSIRVNAKSTLIGATNVRRELRLTSLNCIPEGRTPSVSGGDDFPESITLRAFPSSDGTFPAATTAELVLGTAVLNN